MTTTNGADVFDSLVTAIQILLPNHKRIPNPFELSENNGRILEQGWGLAIAPGGENTGRFSCAQRSLRVTFTLAITRKFYATEHDAAAKAVADKLLLTDFETVLDDSWKNNLSLAGSLQLTPGFAGIQSIFADKDLYRAMNVTLTVEYFRQN